MNAQKLKYIHHGEKETCILAMHFQIEWRSEIGFVLIRKPNEPSEPSEPYDYEEQQSVQENLLPFQIFCTVMMPIISSMIKLVKRRLSAL